MVAIDGTDALAYVILRPGPDNRGVVIEAGANGIGKKHAAYALRHTAQQWDPDDSVGQAVGEQLRAADAEVERLKAELEKYVGKEPTVAEETAYVRSENDRLTAEAEQLRANTRKLVASWRQSSDGHGRMAGSPELLDDKGMVGRQSGRAVQLADCASDLEGVLAGEDPDGWTHGISITAEPA